MTLIKQINESSCFLACLESLFADAGRSVTQHQIIQDFPTETYKRLGAFDLLYVKRLEDAYGFELRITKPIDIIRRGDLIGAENMLGQGSHHVVRFVEHTGTDRIKVMDPKTGAFKEWSGADFILFDCYRCEITLTR